MFGSIKKKWNLAVVALILFEGVNDAKRENVKAMWIVNLVKWGKRRMQRFFKIYSIYSLIWEFNKDGKME